MLAQTDSVLWYFFNRYSGPTSFRLSSKFLYLSIRKIFKWLVNVFKLFCSESIGIDTQKLCFQRFTRAWIPVLRVCPLFCCCSTMTWNNCFPSFGVITSHISWHASSALWITADLSALEQFSQQGTCDWRGSIRGFLTASARLSIQEVENLDWTFNIL